MSPVLSRLLVSALFATLVVACKKADEEPTTETSFEVECIGMSKREPGAGYYLLESDVGGRCQLLISDTVYDPKQVTLLQQGGGNWGQPNTAALLINFAGKKFVARSGSIRFDDYGETAASGRYDLVGVESTTGEEARLSGPIDFCNYGANPECPHQSSGLTALSKHVGFEGPDGFKADFATSRANECRVLIDKKTSAARVDVQVAVLNGVNIARFRDKCGAPVPVTAGFRFMATSVNGPGSYGPITSKPVAVPGGDPTHLPGFLLEAPTVYWLGNCLSSPERMLNVHPIDGTSCKFSITESPGKFELSCTGAQHSEPGNYYTKQGPFELSADCDVRYVN
ncbi:MAG: hypothetical protein HYZ29_28555 [Myxococcales bacterium]|nr:hypothetical protein [Myxococcales bacterium]